MTQSRTALALALVVTLLAAPALAQSEYGDSLAGSAPELRGAGSATVLNGSVGIYHIFVTEQEHEWADVDIELALANIEQSMLFLQYHAESHGMELVFQQDWVSVTYEPGVQDLTTHPQWTEDLLLATGAMSGNDLVATIRRSWGVEHVCIAIHSNKPGRSYALAWQPNNHPIFRSERAVLYTRYPDGQFTFAATYAHEILHLFGACDLYYPLPDPAATEDPFAALRDMAASMFPDDIMRRVDYNITNLTLGDFTAYRIGWNKEIREADQAFEN